MVDPEKFNNLSAGIHGTLSIIEAILEGNFENFNSTHKISIHRPDFRRNTGIVRVDVNGVKADQYKTLKYVFKFSTRCSETTRLSHPMSNEVSFYQKFYNELRGVIPKTLFAGFSNSLSRFIILQENPYITHREWSGVPGQISTGELINIIDSLAKVHGSLLINNYTSNFFSAPYEENLSNDIFAFKKICDEYMATSPALSSSEKIFLRKISNPDEVNKFCSQRPKFAISLLHNDTNEGNFLYSDNEKNNSLILDWETWSYGPVTNDLAYLLILCLSKEYRNAIEMSMLNEYYTRFSMYTKLFSKNDLIRDFAFSVRRSVYLVLSYWYKIGISSDRIDRGLSRAINADLKWSSFIK